METIFIDRKNHRDILRAGEEIIKKLNDGEGVIVFPEGTSSKGEEVLKFNSSFFEFPARLDFPVHYASITHQTPNDHPPANTVCWWGDDNRAYLESSPNTKIQSNRHFWRTTSLKP
jgi:1-acyl-sn-glycerol-3-phosphate acyltransferase